MNLYPNFICIKGKHIRRTRAFIPLLTPNNLFVQSIAYQYSHNVNIDMTSVKINMFFISHLMCNIMLIIQVYQIPPPPPLYYLLNMSQLGLCMCVCVCVCVCVVFRS